MVQIDNFDRIISSTFSFSKPLYCNFAQMIFNNSNHKANQTALISHEKSEIVEISYLRLHFIIAELYLKFKKNGMNKGDTVFLVDQMINNELYGALLFLALTSYGMRTFLPMFIETSEIKSWLKASNTRYAILPETEIFCLKKHEKQKAVISNLHDLFKDVDVVAFDIIKDFEISDLIHQDIPKDFSIKHNELVKKAEEVKSTHDAVIFTTSGTSGRSKLVVYDHKRILSSCASWDSSNFFDNKLLGGRNLVELLAHTISIRSLCNGVYSGGSTALFTSGYAKESPIDFVNVLRKLDFEAVTFGPSSLNVILELADNFGVSSEVFSHVKKIVSTGKKYNMSIANRYKKMTGVVMENGYGTTETNQILSTLLNPKKTKLRKKMPLGKPLAGVKIGLKRIQDKNMYKLYVSSPFNYKYLIGLDGNKDSYCKEFHDTGDLVSINKDDDLFFIGRENRDFINSGFGMKIPLSFMKNRYEKLYEIADHIEYFCREDSSLNMGLSALIFIKNSKKKRASLNKNIKEIIKKENNEIKQNAEPFEYDFRRIEYFTIIRSNVPKTSKSEPSRNLIQKMFVHEIEDLKNHQGKNIISVIPINERLLISIFGFISKNKKLAKLILKIG